MTNQKDVTEAMIEAAHYAACRFAAPNVEPPFPFNQVDDRRRAGIRAMLEAALQSDRKPLPMRFSKDYIDRIKAARHLMPPEENHD